MECDGIILRHHSDYAKNNRHERHRQRIKYLHTNFQHHGSDHVDYGHCILSHVHNMHGYRQPDDDRHRGRYDQYGRILGWKQYEIRIAQRDVG